MNTNTRIGLSTFSALAPDGKQHSFSHFLDSKDVAYVVDATTESVLFKFDNGARMSNSKGTVVGAIHFIDVATSKLGFFVPTAEGDTYTTKVFEPRAKYHFEAEPEIIKWLVSTGQFQKFIDA